MEMTELGTSASRAEDKRRYESIYIDFKRSVCFEVVLNGIGEAPAAGRAPLWNTGPPW